MQQPTPVRQPVTTTPTSTTERSAGAATVATSAPPQVSQPATTATPKSKPKAKPKPHVPVHRVDPVRAERPTFVNLPAAVAAARREAGILGHNARATTGTSLSDGELVAAAALLLLFVAAAASVLRLSARMVDDMPAGRFG